MRRPDFSIIASLVFAAAALFSLGCSEGQSGSACSIDDDCGERGLICSADDECVERECATNPDCGANRICFEGSCTPYECTADSDCASGTVCVGRICQDPSSTTCTSDDDCAAFGRVCNPITQQCVEPEGCTVDTDCAPGEACNPVNGTCVPGCVLDTDCPAEEYCAQGSCEEGCREDGCAEGETCDTTSRSCVDACSVSECAALGQACDPASGQCVERSGKALCEQCTSGSTECGGPGDRCHPLGGSFVCTFACETDADCSSGFRCTPLTTAAKGCVPISGACEGCLVSGCSTGEVCNPDTTECQTGVDSCRPCTENFECGTGSLCADFGGRDRCLQTCSASGTCATGYTCNSTSSLCEPDTGSCTNCQIDPSTCAAGEVLDEDRCACVGCISDTDCDAGAGESCAQGSGECVPGLGPCTSANDCTSSVCHGTAEGLPGQCVECVAATDCAAGSTCNAFECVDCGCPVGQECQPDGSCLDPNVCSTNADCVARKGEGYVCDAGQSNLCYLPGECNPGDPTLAPCPSGMCGGGMFPIPTCSCNALNPTSCRVGETCFPTDFQTFDGFCVPAE